MTTRRKVDAEAALRFWLAIVPRGRCAVCGTTRWLQAHHVISQQLLRRLHLEHELWNPDNGLALDEDHHRRHELAVERVPRDRLRPENLAFAERLDLMWWLEKRYPVGAK